MTSYEQYEEIAHHIKNYFQDTSVFMMGEKINISPPYIVVQSYGITNEACGFTGSTRKDVKGYNIFCYEKNIGKTEKLISDVLDEFTANSTTNKLELDKLEFSGIINRLENTLFEGVISFQVSSIFNK